MNSFWEDTGSMFDIVLPIIEEEPAMAFTVKQDNCIYYYCFFDIAGFGGTSTICLISDVTEAGNDNHISGLKHFRKYCLGVKNVSQGFLNVASGCNDLSFLKEAQSKRNSYKIIGRMVSIPLFCEDNSAARCFEIQEVCIAPEYRGRALAHKYFDFLTLMTWQKIHVLTTNMVIGDDEVVVA